MYFNMLLSILLWIVAINGATSNSKLPFGLISRADTLTNTVLSNLSVVCASRADCSNSPYSVQSSYITCVNRSCYCDPLCFALVNGRCSVRTCFTYTMGTDSCIIHGRDWKVLILLAKYLGFSGAPYFFLGKWTLGLAQMSVFIASMCTFPLLLCISCCACRLFCELDLVDQSDPALLLMKFTLGGISLCCVQIMCTCACTAWYVVVTILVKQNLLYDIKGCQPMNQPTFITVV